MMLARLYSSYINQYFISMELIQSHSASNPRFASFLETQAKEVSLKLKKSIDLKSLLHLPIQRIGFYRLMFTARPLPCLSGER